MSIARRIFAPLCGRSSTAWAPNELRRRKQAQNVLAFEDLLTRLDEALRGPGGSALAESIREKYRAALVDEFQDTDPVQYSIFERIYQGSDATVALIGDPKQAIYAFRGADVFTYLNASRATRQAVHPAHELAFGKRTR